MSSTPIKTVDNPGVFTLQTVGSITPLNLIRQGPRYTNRVGRRIRMVSLELHGAFIPFRTGPIDYVRVMIIYDRQPNRSLPAIGDILLDVDEDGTTTSTNSYSMKNPNYADRFLVLRDHRHLLPSLTLTAAVVTNLGVVDSVNPTFIINDFIPLDNLITQYAADTAPPIAGDITTGGLYLVTIGANAAGTEPFRFFAANRLRFFDD